MYKIGEKIVYPMHGAGIIQDIEEKEVLGETQKYYVLKIPATQMKLMVPVNSAENIGVRPVVSSSDISKIFDKIKAQDEDESQNWNKRYRENLLKIRTGSIVEVGKVVKTLTHREMDKPLSTCEKKMLNNARQILLSELVLATDGNEEKIKKDIDALIAL